MRYLIANWKMHFVPLPQWMQAVTAAHFNEEALELVLCPAFTQLSAAQMVRADTHLRLGGQDCHAEEKGAFTGDISAEMLRRSGCQYVICGHSERRAHHGETAKLVKAKAEAAIEAGLTPVICIGESREEHEAGNTKAVIEAELSVCLPKDDDYIIAYEPIWAIGTGLTPTLEEIEGTHQLIKQHTQAPVLYGGSAKPDNIAEIIRCDGVDGALVGSASLDGESFAAMVRALQETP